MKKMTMFVAVLLLLTGSALAAPDQHGDDRAAEHNQAADNHRRDNSENGRAAHMLEFGTMVALPKAFTGTNNEINGVPGGGLPWVITSGKGELSIDGHLEIEVEGLVLDPNDPDVQAKGLAGQNPIPAFKAIVSCRTSDGGTANILTADQFPATTGAASAGGGNAMIDAMLQLPQPCIAPVVFVTSPTGAWFATTGH